MGEISNPAELLHDICSGVLSDFDRFNRYEIKRADLDHIDVNVRVGKQMALKYAVAFYVRDDECLQSFAFDRADPDFPSASGHSYEEHVRANIVSWGLLLDDLKFSSGGDGKRIKVGYELLSEFKREPETVDAMSLCIVSLMSMDPEVGIFGMSFAPADYDKMEIVIRRGQSVGFFSFYRKWGPVEFGIKDGLCTAASAA
ncbi:MAG: hypothetical protein AAF666_09280 [Pseudomonadota bacterium]